MSGNGSTNDPPQSTGSWSSFLKSIASFSGDLSNLTAPPFILSATSLTEYSAYWVSHPSLLTDTAKEEDPARRAALVLKWFISTLKQQYSSRNEKLGSEKKPLNPFLANNHHPPVTAYCIWDEENTVQLQGYNGQKASISRSLSINVKQIGHAILRLPAHNEAYLITLPSLHIEGLMSGSPYVELSKHSSIASTSGYTARIEYSGRGWLSGRKNSFNATLASTEDPKHVLYTAEGQWTGAFVIKDASTKDQIDEWNPEGSPAVMPMVRDVEEQAEFESRRAWAKVAEAIRKGDMEVTQREKGIIENRQREMRKEEEAQGKQWERKYFRREKADPVFDELAPVVGEEAEPEKTDGIWVWSGESVTKEKN